MSWYRSPSVLNAPLARVVRRAGVPEISPHALRRAFEDLGRRAGIDSLVRRAISGWRADRAQAIYATVSRDERLAAAEAMCALVGV